MSPFLDFLDNRFDRAISNTTGSAFSSPPESLVPTLPAGLGVDSESKSGVSLKTSDWLSQTSLEYTPLIDSGSIAPGSVAGLGLRAPSLAIRFEGIGFDDKESSRSISLTGDIGPTKLLFLGGKPSCIAGERSTAVGMLP